MKAELLEIPSGDAGTYATVQKMRELARGADPRVAEFARRLVGGCSEAVAVARLFAFVRDEIENSEDPPGIEWLQSPQVTLGQNPAGDCDDKAILLAALLRAVGIPVRFVVISTKPSRRYSHVYLEARTRGLFGVSWLPLDPKNPRAAPGWAYPLPTRVERVEV